MAVSTISDRIEPISRNEIKGDLPADLERDAKKYTEFNVHPYFSFLAMQQEKLVDGKIIANLDEIKKKRDNLKTLNQFLTVLREKIATTPDGHKIKLNEINNANGNLLDKTYELFPNDLLKKSEITKDDAHHLILVVTRKGDQDLIPEIQDVTRRNNKIIEDLEKILPMIKDLQDKWEKFMQRIQDRQRGR